MKWKHHLERVVGRGSVGAVEVPLPGGVADVLEVEVDALVAVLGHDGGPAGGAAGGAGRRRPAGDGELPAGDGAAGEALHGHGLHGDGGGEGGHGARTGCCVAHWCPSAYYVHKLNSVESYRAEDFGICLGGCGRLAWREDARETHRECATWPALDRLILIS